MFHRYISEISPPLVRGFLIGMHEISFQVTSVFGFWINYGVNKHIPARLPAQWMIPLGVQLVPGIILFFASICVLPESPRFLIRKNQARKANACLAYIRNLPELHIAVLAELDEIQKYAEETEATAQNLPQNFANLRGIFSSADMRARLFSGCLMMLFLNTTGAVALNSYSPAIFTSIGFKGTDLALLLTGFFALTKCITVTISSVYFVDRYGRKVLLMIGAVGVSAVML